MRDDLTERLAATVYKQGEAKKKAGDGAGAVEDFLRVARVAPDSKIRSTAEYDAAAQLITLKQWDRAIGVLEDFRRDYPKSELQADVTRKLAVAYTEAQPAGPGCGGVRAHRDGPDREPRTCSAKRCCSRRICTPRPTTRRRPWRCWRSSSRRTRRRSRMRMEARQRLADYRRQGRRRRERRTTGTARSSRRIARPARSAPTARTTWPRRRNSRWPSRRGMPSGVCG